MCTGTVPECRRFDPTESRQPDNSKPGLAGRNYNEPPTKLALTFAIIAAGLAGRSALDKILALRGGAELVALWAQLSAVIEMVAAVASSGVGAGLSVLVAQTVLRDRQVLFLRRAIVLGLAVAAPVACAAALGGWRFADSIGGNELARGSLVFAAAAGWIAVAHGVVNSFWLGQQRRDLMLALALAAAAAALAAGAFAPRGWVLEAVTLSQALPSLVALLVWRRSDAQPRAEDRALERYLLPGVVIGVLSPLSMLVARSVVAESLSWHESGVLQALWRLSDWIAGFAAGVLSLLYLPRLAAAYPAPGMGPVLRQSAVAVLTPCALLFVLLFLFHQPLLEALYDASFRAPPLAAALLFAGSLVRIAAWIPLFGLYA
ncbi:MAG TPA: hypothetical protein VFO94_17535, partial [Gammaproteobacteria bacterium]|nr:hypothetical protein [Gammaproteobacteria bacterium]